MAVSISDLDFENLTAVRVAHLIDPATFWIVPLDDVDKAEEIQTALTDYFRDHAVDKVTSFAAGERVAVLHPKQEKWMRAEVQEAGDPTSLLFLLDDGMVVNMATSNLRPLPPDFGSKFLAIRLHLRGVRPVEDDFDGSWSRSAYEHVSALLYAAESCYLHTAPGAGDVIGDVLFGSLLVHANNQLVDLGADLDQRGFATRSKRNAFDALEKFVMEPLCLGPNIHDPRQVCNPMRPTSVQKQNAYEEPTHEQRLLGETVGRGRQRPPPALAEHRPIQYFAAGHNISRLPQMDRRLPPGGSVQTSPPPNGGSQARPPLNRGLGRAGLGKSPNASGSSSCVTTPTPDSRMPSLGEGDSSFADISMSGSRDSSITVSSGGESPVVGKPSRRQFFEQLSSQLSSVGLNDSIGSSDASLLAANDSVSSADSPVPKGRAKRRDAIMAMLQANQQPAQVEAGEAFQPAQVDTGDAVQPVRLKRWHLLDKFREDSTIDDMASVSQRQDESLGNLSLMNVSGTVNATPVKMSRSERLRMMAAMESTSTPIPWKADISAIGLQE